MKSISLALLLGLVLTSCSSNMPSGQQQKPSSEAATKPTADANRADTGRVAFQRMYVAARGWSRDAMPVGLESTPTKDFPGKDGKADLTSIRESMQEWGGVTPRERAAVIEGGGETIIEPYKKLIDDYYKSLATKATQQ